MIDNVFVQCNYCKAKIRLRFQMGFFDIPFGICCPDCSVHIYGLREMENDCSITVRNASVINCELDGADYYADFSVELPHIKTTKYESLEKMVETGFSPFMMTSCLYGNETYLKLISHMRNFLVSVKSSSI